MEKQIKLMNEFLSDTHVMNVKLHSIHWNIVGDKFVPIHQLSESFYNEFFEMYDQVAERIEMLGEKAISSVKGYLENSKINELESRNFKYKEALEIMLEDFKYFKKGATDIRNLADENGDFATISLFEGYIERYCKHIWFIEASLK